jgi:DNA (cytosine-5)-methyltransferase 1
MSEAGNRDFSMEALSHIPRRVGELVQRRIDALGIGQRMQDLPEELWHESFKFYVKHDPNRKGGPNLRLIRLDPKRPSLTVTGFIFNKFVHPFENRFITPREAARLQGFPDDFLFKGSITSVHRQVGNAVPVQLAQAVAQQVLEHIETYSLKSLNTANLANGKLPVISLFSGAGGMDLGFERASTRNFQFSPEVCIEHDEDCCKTLAANFTDSTQVIHADIQTMDTKWIKNLKDSHDGCVPIVIGGPPCQSFSQAGKQKGIDDPRGNLIFEFLRFISELKPIYFVMENVSNLKGVQGGRLLKEIESEIESLGYNLSLGVLSAADYGTPQLRKRILLVGVQKPYPAVALPTPTHFPVGQQILFGRPHLGVGDAFAGLPVILNSIADLKISI